VTTAVQSAHSEFAAIVGDSRILCDPAACQGYAVDGKVPSLVVFPQSAEHVAAVLKCAADHDVAVIPCRNLTKIGIGNPPRRYDVALSLKELNRVWYYEPADLVVSAEPGMKFSDLQHLLSRHRLWLPLEPVGGDRASIGGILATNSAGPLRAAYGGPRDMVLGMKIATTEGKIIKAGGRVVKNVTGYDTAKLLIGSYGTLGVIVEASLKLFPRLPDTTTFVVTAGTLEKARELRRAIQQAPLERLRMLLLDRNMLGYFRESAGLIEWEGGWQLWIQAGGSETVLDRCSRELEQIARKASVPLITRRKPDGVTETVWCWPSSLHYGAGIVGHDLLLKASLPVAATEEYLNRAYETTGATATIRSLAQPAVGVVMLGLGPPVDTNEIVGLIRTHHHDRTGPEAMEAWRENYQDRFNAWAEPAVGLAGKLRALAIGMGGALVAEVVPNELKGRIDAWGPPGDDFEIMRKMKQTWDPKAILSPGRFVGGL
jgi:glycolate oxidase FAD binding subunit